MEMTAVLMTIETQLIRDEGVRLFAYQDTLGYLTIGVGRCIDHRKGEGITQDEAMMLLHNDIANVKTALAQRFAWFDSLNDARQGALINMAFNLGVPGVCEFHQTLNAIQDSRYSDAAKAMLDSTWAKQVGDRAERLAKQMESGEWV